MRINMQRCRSLRATVKGRGIQAPGRASAESKPATGRGPGKERSHRRLISFREVSDRLWKMPVNHREKRLGYVRHSGKTEASRPSVNEESGGILEDRANRGPVGGGKGLSKRRRGDAPKAGIADRGRRLIAAREGGTRIRPPGVTSPTSGTASNRSASSLISEFGLEES